MFIYFVFQPDESDECHVLNIGLYLEILDKVIRKYKDPKNFKSEDEEFRLTLKLVATKRRLNGESTEECYERLLRHSKIFESIYRERGGKFIICCTTVVNRPVDLRLLSRGNGKICIGKVVAVPVIT